jgi:dihydrofolate reductase
MGKIVNSTFVSLDGVINHMDKWHFDYVSGQSKDFALQQLRESDAMLMGRGTYEVYASTWPGRDGDLAERINAIPKHVISTTLTDPEWNATTVVKTDLVEAAAQLKETAGTILMHGFGPVAKSLVGAGLLDELHLWYHPVLAGVGGPDDVLLTPGLHAVFERTATTTFDNGVVVISLQSRA